MHLEDLIGLLRHAYDGFNLPAAEADLARAAKTFGPLPADILQLYRDHDGSAALPSRANRWLAARLMPLTEALDLRPALSHIATAVGDIAWLWSDDNSNFLGVFTSGLLVGWLVKLNHEEPLLTPAYRSVAGFLNHLWESGPGVAADGTAALDLISVPREIPVVADDPRQVDAERSLARSFSELHVHESDEELRRLYAMCAICLTPVSDTGTVVRFFTDCDMWTPERAVLLMEHRRYGGAVQELERLAREGRPNGDSAAMRILVRLGSNASRAAVARLQLELTSQKQRSLDLWVRNRDRLQPPRWE